MAEWSNALVLKTSVLQGTGGSNPSFSAKYMRAIHRDTRLILAHNPTGELINILTKLYLARKAKLNKKNEKVL